MLNITINQYNYITQQHSIINGGCLLFNGLWYNICDTDQPELERYPNVDTMGQIRRSQCNPELYRILEINKNIYNASIHSLTKQVDTAQRRAEQYIATSESVAPDIITISERGRGRCRRCNDSRALSTLSKYGGHFCKRCYDIEIAVRDTIRNNILE